jgi:hypothetical protein
MMFFHEAAAQRRALPAWGGRVDSPSKWDSAEAGKILKKRGAYPKSGARIVGRILGFSLLLYQKSPHFINNKFFMLDKTPMMPLRNFDDSRMRNIMAEFLNQFSLNGKSDLLSVYIQNSFLLIG